jgi:putative transposase
MASAPRGFFRGEYYHVYNRGHHQDFIFRDEADRQYFLTKLDEFCMRDGIAVIAYCLLDNHFHLILRQDGDTSPSLSMGSLLSGYVRVYNRKYGAVGNLFQGRFQAKLVHDKAYLLHLSRYIHLNPHPFADFRTYRWSSYREYVDGIPAICETGSVLNCVGDSKDNYAMYVEKGASPGE